MKSSEGRSGRCVLLSLCTIFLLILVVFSPISSCGYKFVDCNDSADWGNQVESSFITSNNGSEAYSNFTLNFSTFIGGSSWDTGYDMVVDDLGYVYVTGGTYSTDFPLHSWKVGRPKFGDCFVIKLSPDGRSLIYSTFIGGSNFDIATSIAVDSEGCVYVTGYTASSDFPMVGAYDSTFNSDHSEGYITKDCFVFKLSPTGDRLIYSTFVGGAGDDRVAGLDLDSEGNVYVAGKTNTIEGFPIDTAINDTTSGIFVFKLNASGNSLLYSTILGIAEYGITYADNVHDIVVQSNGCVSVTGITSSDSIPKVNAFDDTLNGSADCFVFTLSSDGSSLVYSTFLGGTDHDWGNVIAIDDAGAIIIAGVTASPDFPGTSNSTLNGLSDCFIAKLSPSGDSIEFTVLIGGSEGEWPQGIAMDDDRVIYITGRTSSEDFPTTYFSYDGSYNGGWDCFVLGLNMTSREIVYSSYLGGTYSDMGVAIAVGQNRSIYVAGTTYSHDFPVVAGYDLTYNGGDSGSYWDVFVCKIGIPQESGASDSLVFIVGIGVGSVLLITSILFIRWKKSRLVQD